MNYEKRYTDAVGNYEIYFIYDDGREQRVSDIQDLYQAWLADGNTPTEIEYVEPSPPPIPSIEEQQRMLEQACRRYQDQYFSDSDRNLMLLKAVTELTPKAVAMREWFSVLWQIDYQARLAGINEETMVDIDFSGHGIPPYGILETIGEEIVA